MTPSPQPCNTTHPYHPTTAKLMDDMTTPQQANETNDDQSKGATRHSANKP